MPSGDTPETNHRGLCSQYVRTHRALLVLAHPRVDSLTAQIAERACRCLESRRFDVDYLDLYAEGFDPRMTPADEPDWADPDKKYSSEVHRHMARIDVADAIIVVFPVWWSAPPAMLKGWIDRVWAFGFAYGRRTARLVGKRMLWIGLAGGSQQDFARYGLKDLVDRQLRVEIANFCGITDAYLSLIHETDHANERHDEIMASADDALDEFLGEVSVPNETLDAPATSRLEEGQRCGRRRHTPPSQAIGEP